MKASFRLFTNKRQKQKKTHELDGMNGNASTWEMGF